MIESSGRDEIRVMTNKCTRPSRERSELTTLCCVCVIVSSSGKARASREKVTTGESPTLGDSSSVEVKQSQAEAERACAAQSVLGPTNQHSVKAVSLSSSSSSSSSQPHNSFGSRWIGMCVDLCLAASAFSLSLSFNSLCSHAPLTFRGVRASRQLSSVGAVSYRELFFFIFLMNASTSTLHPLTEWLVRSRPGLFRKKSALGRDSLSATKTCDHDRRICYIYSLRAMDSLINLS